MARLFGDGFDHYGTDETNMTDGVYAQVYGQLSTTVAATGTHSFLCDTATGLLTHEGLRKVLPASKDKMGAMAHFYFGSLPSQPYEAAIFSFLTSDPQRAQLEAFLDPNGAIRFVRGAQTYGLTGSSTSGTLIATTDPIIVTSAWNHIEVQVYIHDTLGWIRVAVNGVHRYAGTGLDTKYDSTNIVSCSQHRSYLSNSAGGNFYIDDLIYYDFVGTSSTDTDFCPAVDGSGVATNYIGELQGMWNYPNGNTAEDDWSKSTGSSAYPLVGKTTPNDATYIYSTAAGDLTELDLTDLPAEITYIRGVDYWGRMAKSDSGAAMTKFGAKSSASATDATERPITVEPTYWWDQINLDPATAARWTRTGFNASKYRITRSV